MKKTLLAAALMAGFAGIAQAETSVTLYGILDGGIGFQQIKGSVGAEGNPYATERNQDFKNKRTGLIGGIQSGNRWGLKGSEDLGNGLRAVFVLESGFNIANGNQAQGGRLFGRQATLGLAGDSWGQLDLGRQTNIASKYIPGVGDPFGGGFDQANIGGALSAANTARYDNMVMYQTPNFSGFQFGVGYSTNVDAKDGDDWDRDGTKNNKAGWTTGLRYVNGPIGAALSYDQFKDRNGFLANGGEGNVTAKAWAAAFSYDFEVVKLHLAGGQTRDGLFATQSYADETFLPSFKGLKGLRVNSYLAGLSAPVGAGKVMASWHMADLDKAPHALNVAGNEFKKQHTYSLGYTHPLSKRTNVYAIGSYAKNVQFAPDAKSTLVGVGLRHQF